MQKKAIILFSGGLDSTTCLALAKEQGFACYALSFNFGQKHQAELAAAKRIAEKIGVVEHQVFSLSFDSLIHSALIQSSHEIKDYTGDHQIPATYVPARNTIFLSIALGWAETIGAFDIFVGVNSIDYSGYPDCRPAYLNTFQTLANLATKAGVEGKKFHIHAPLVLLNKAAIIKEGLRLGIDYRMTVSCYRADKEGKACGSCDSCTFRKKGFQEAGVQDVTVYQ